MRIYVIGDIHGRVDLLTNLFDRIDADRGSLAISKTLQVFLGDYVDRGLHSREVIDALIARGARCPAVFMKGNHEAYLMEFLLDSSILASWRQFGGMATLVSYGLTPTLAPDEDESIALWRALNRSMPTSHREFLAQLKLFYVCGDFFFAHAGVRPGTSLARQSEQDLLWIREDFIASEQRYEKIIVHGHTPVLDPEIRSNRINVDTGAYATGRLTCLVLEEDERRFIHT
jgi:serine/threonine protein phosphatase 1